MTGTFFQNLVILVRVYRFRESSLCPSSLLFVELRLAYECANAHHDLATPLEEKSHCVVRWRKRYFSPFIHRVEARRWFVVEEDGFFSENLYVGEKSFAGRYFWRGREGKDDNGEWGKWTNFNWIGNLIVKWGKYIFLMGIWFDESQKFFSVSFGLVEILGNEFKNWEDRIFRENF